MCWTNNKQMPQFVAYSSNICVWAFSYDKNLQFGLHSASMKMFHNFLRKKKSGEWTISRKITRQKQSCLEPCIESIQLVNNCEGVRPWRRSVMELCLTGIPAVCLIPCQVPSKLPLVNHSSIFSLNLISTLSLAWSHFYITLFSKLAFTFYLTACFRSLVICGLLLANSLIVLQGMIISS